MTLSNFRWLPLVVLPLFVVAVGLLAADPSKPTDPPPKAKEKVKRNATVERVKLVGIGGLLEQDAIRKDLGLTQEQVEKFDTVQEEMRKQLKALRASLMAAPPKQEPEIVDIQRMTDALTDCVFQTDAAIQKLLTADQQYRLKQIQLQRDGPNALLGRHAVRELALTPDQEDKIADALKGLNKPKMSDITTSVKGVPEEPRSARYLAAYTADLDAAREEALKHLTADQKAKWKEMTGEQLPTVCLLVATPEGFAFRENFKLAGGR